MSANNSLQSQSSTFWFHRHILWPSKCRESFLSRVAETHFVGGSLEHLVTLSVSLPTSPHPYELVKTFTIKPYKWPVCMVPWAGYGHTAIVFKTDMVLVAPSFLKAEQTAKLIIYNLSGVDWFWFCVVFFSCYTLVQASFISGSCWWQLCLPCECCCTWKGCLVDASTCSVLQKPIQKLWMQPFAAGRWP